MSLTWKKSCRSPAPKEGPRVTSSCLRRRFEKVTQGQTRSVRELGDFEDPLSASSTVVKGELNPPEVGGVVVIL